MSAANSPWQSSILVDSSVCVVVPAGQATHSAVGLSAVPPAEYVPTEQLTGSPRLLSNVLQYDTQDVMLRRSASKKT